MPQITDLYQKLSSKLHGWLEGFVVMLPNLGLSLLIVAIGILAANVGQRLVHRVIHRLTGNETISQLLATLARIAIIAIGLFYALGLLQLDKTVTSLLAGIGVVGLALGFAFQDIAANFMSGFIMALNKPFEVGDLVLVAGHRGRIKRISFRASEIETLEGLSVLVPNKEIFQNAIVNYTNTPQRRLDFAMGTAYGDNMDKVRNVVLQAVQNVSNRDTSRDVQLYFTEFGDSSINFMVHIWLSRSDELTYLAARSDAMVAIKNALDQNKLTIPFPIRTLDFGADAIGGKRLDEMRLRLAEPRSAAS